MSVTIMLIGISVAFTLALFFGAVKVLNILTKEDLENFKNN